MTPKIAPYAWKVMKMKKKLLDQKIQTVIISFT